MTKSAEILEYFEAELAKADAKAKALTDDWAEVNVKYWAKANAYAKAMALVRSTTLKAMILEIKGKDE